MQVGISQLIAPKLSLEEFFKKSASNGYEAVELCLRKDGGLTLGTNDIELKSIVDLAEQYQLEIVSMTHSQRNSNHHRHVSAGTPSQ